MAFENVNIHSTRNGSTPVNGWRQDLVIADVIVLSLTDYTGVSTLEWSITRPEGSVAGGAGPDPVILGTSTTASFVVDDDTPPLPRDGTYIVFCRINPESDNETIVTTGLARLNAATVDAKPLRLLGAGETIQDTSDPLTNLGWMKMANRLWRKGLAGAGTVLGSTPQLGRLQFGTTGHSSGKAVDLIQLVGSYGTGLPNLFTFPGWATPSGASSLKENALYAEGHLISQDCQIDAIGFYQGGGVLNAKTALNVYRARTDGLLFPGALICSTGLIDQPLSSAQAYREFTTAAVGTLPFTAKQGELLWFGIVGGTRNQLNHNGPSVGCWGFSVMSNLPPISMMGIVRVADGTNFASGIAAAGDLRDNIFGLYWRSDDNSFAAGGSYTPPDPFPEVNLANMCAPFVAGDVSSTINMPALFFHPLHP